MSFRRSSAAPFIALLVAVSAAAAHAAPATREKPQGESIAWLTRHVKRHPSAWGARIELARAELALASRTLDPTLLSSAREQVRLSLATQPSVEGWKQAARAEAFAHQFEAALSWARRAAEALPEDSEALSLEVEALLGLGRVDEAQALVTACPVAATEFHAMASRGRISARQQRWDDAVDAFTRAAALAREVDVPELEAWALAQAAGARIDSAHVREAWPFLEQASAADPQGREVLLHRAEAFLMEGKFTEALAICRSMVRKGDDVEALLLGIRAARGAGDQHVASAYLSRARRRLEAAAASGEPYGAGALALLPAR